MIIKLSDNKRQVTVCTSPESMYAQESIAINPYKKVWAISDIKMQERYLSESVCIWLNCDGTYTITSHFVTFDITKGQVEKILNLIRKINE